MSDYDVQFMHHHEVQLIAALGILGALGGIGKLLWAKIELTRGQWVGAAILSFFSAILMALWLWDPLSTRPTQLAAVALLSGIGGTTLVSAAIAVLERRLRRKLEDRSDA